MPGVDTAIQPWRITWGERSYTDEDMTASDGIDVGLLVGFEWEDLNPFKSLRHLLSHIAVLEARTTGTDLEQVFAAVKQAPLWVVVGALTPR